MHFQKDQWEPTPEESAPASLHQIDHALVTLCKRATEWGFEYGRHSLVAVLAAGHDAVSVHELSRVRKHDVRRMQTAISKHPIWNNVFIGEFLRARFRSAD